MQLVSHHEDELVSVTSGYGHADRLLRTTLSHLHNLFAIVGTTYLQCKQFFSVPEILRVKN